MKKMASTGQKFFRVIKEWSTERPKISEIEVVRAGGRVFFVRSTEAVGFRTRFRQEDIGEFCFTPEEAVIEAIDESMKAIRRWRQELKDEEEYLLKLRELKGGKHEGEKE